MSDEKVVYLGAHSRMTVEETLAEAGRRNWEKVIVLGYVKEHNDLVAFSSHMPRETALWLTENMRCHVLDLARLD